VPKNKGNSDALIAIHYFPDGWIIDSRASHQLAAMKFVLSYLTLCMGPTILMGDGTLVEVIGQGRLDLLYGSFENILHVLKFSMNLLSIY